MVMLVYCGTFKFCDLFDCYGYWMWCLLFDFGVSACVWCGWVMLSVVIWFILLG